MLDLFNDQTSRVQVFISINFRTIPPLLDKADRIQFIVTHISFLKKEQDKAKQRLGIGSDLFGENLKFDGGEEEFWSDSEDENPPFEHVEVSSPREPSHLLRHIDLERSSSLPEIL